MNVKSFCSIGNLDFTNYALNRSSVLPSSISEFNLVLEEPMPIRMYEYFMFYDKKHKKLYLRYFTRDIPSNFNYWKKVKVGELIHYTDKTFESKLAKAKANKRLYFHVATTEDRYIYYYLLKPTDEKKIGEIIKMIFIPSLAFVKRCADSDEVSQKLKKYFHEYADYVNGHKYVIRTDTYDLNSDRELIYVGESNWSEVIIGYQNAIDALKQYQIPDLSVTK